MAMPQRDDVIEPPRSTTLATAMPTAKAARRNTAERHGRRSEKSTPQAS